MASTWTTSRPASTSFTTPLLPSIGPRLSCRRHRAGGARARAVGGRGGGISVLEEELISR
jgi:hypothetical protein